MADDLMTNRAIDLDLNVVPSDSSSGSTIQLWSLLDELENTHGQIEDRIRHLEAATDRARQRQRRTAPAPVHPTNLLANNSQQETGTEERAKSGKRDRACLIAEALDGFNTVTKNSTTGDGNGFFDCNVCFGMAKEPILTCCGHLFCWACFHQLPYVYSTAKECPSCLGEVAENKIVPIYGNGGNVDSTNAGFGSRIPPRPKANRVESSRDDGRFTHIPVSVALRRIGIEIDSHEIPNTPIRILPNFSEAAVSVTSISSAINSAERLVEDLESYLRNHVLRRRTDSNIAYMVNNTDTVVPIVYAGAESSEEEQLVRRITNAGAFSFGRPNTGLGVPRVADEGNETSHEGHGRRLI